MKLTQVLILVLLSLLGYVKARGADDSDEPLAVRRIKSTKTTTIKSAKAPTIKSTKTTSTKSTKTSTTKSRARRDLVIDYN